MENELGIRESETQLGGIELEEGSIKTSRGTIRTPKSVLKKRTENKPESQNNNTSYFVPEPKPTITAATIPVVIHSDFGDIIYNCVDIVKTGRFLVLEMLDNVFCPKSYEEAPNLRLPISWENNKGVYIYTGCGWRQQRTNRYFIILMEAPNDD